MKKLVTQGRRTRETKTPRLAGRAPTALPQPLAEAIMRGLQNGVLTSPITGEVDTTMSLSEFIRQSLYLALQRDLARSGSTVSVDEIARGDI